MAESTSEHQQALIALLRQVLLDRQSDGHKETLAQFGAVLATLVSENRQPYSKQYIARLRDGKDRITPEIAGALEVLASMAEGVSALHARARPVRVLAVCDLPPNTVIMGQARQCALPGCGVNFVPASPSQRYCSPECGREAIRRRRKAAALAAAIRNRQPYQR